MTVLVVHTNQMDGQSRIENEFLSLKKTLYMTVIKVVIIITNRFINFTFNTIIGCYVFS